MLKMNEKCLVEHLGISSAKFRYHLLAGRLPIGHSSAEDFRCRLFDEQDIAKIKEYFAQPFIERPLPPQD
jgi:hypothetical protein